MSVRWTLFNLIAMKKILMIAVMALGFVATAAAGDGPRAIGIRGGYGVELSYQHNLGSNFVEADLGLVGSYINVAATYNWMIATPQFTDRGDWGVYAGPGASVGLGGGFHVAAAGMVGLEYQFWFPLQLSVDIRPQLGLGMGGDEPLGLHFSGYWPTLGVRYKF